MNFGMTFVLTHSIENVNYSDGWPFGVSTFFPEGLNLAFSPRPLPPPPRSCGGGEESEPSHSPRTWSAGVSEPTGTHGEGRSGLATSRSTGPRGGTCGGRRGRGPVSASRPRPGQAEGPGAAHR